jgi:hypothetical protein
VQYVLLAKSFPCNEFFPLELGAEECMHVYSNQTLSADNNWIKNWSHILCDGVKLLSELGLTYQPFGTLPRIFGGTFYDHGHWVSLSHPTFLATVLI